MRADLSVIRITQFNYFEDMKRLTTSSNASLRNIESNTAAIMRSNDAIQRSSQAILDRIDGLKKKTWKMPIA